MKEKCWEEEGSTYSCQCEPGRHDWRNVAGSAPTNHQKKRNAKRPCKNPDLPKIDGQESDDEDKDDDHFHHHSGSSNPGAGYYHACQTQDHPGPSGSGDGNTAQGRNRSSAASTSYKSNDGGPNQCQPSSLLAVVALKTTKTSSQPALSLNTSPRGLNLPTTDSEIEIKSRFKSVRVLGRGAFGDVDEIVWKSTNKTYARKIIRLTSKTTSVSAEVEILKGLHHKHIVELAAHWRTSKQLWLFMTPVAITDLGGYLRGDATCGMMWPDRELLWKWESCLASALQYLHAMNIRHGDIKPSNILISSDLNVYLADFGSARANCFEQSQGTAQTPKYCAPEISNHHPLGRAADIFSLGCVWAEIETVCAGLSIQAFETFRSAGSSDGSFRANLSRTYRWLDFLWTLQQPFLSTPSDYTHARTNSQINDMLNFDPLRRPTADYLTTMFRCVCASESSIMSRRISASSPHALTSSSNSSCWQQLESSLQGWKSNVTLEWKQPTAGFWSKHQARTINRGPQCTYKLRWDNPIWEAMLATSAAPCFVDNKINESQLFFRSSKTYLLSGDYADIYQLKVQDDDAQVTFYGKYLLDKGADICSLKNTKKYLFSEHVVAVASDQFLTTAPPLNSRKDILCPLSSASIRTTHQAPCMACILCPIFFERYLHRHQSRTLSNYGVMRLV